MGNMHQTGNEFERLVIHFLERTITDKELEILQLLLKGSREKMQLFLEIREVWLETRILGVEKLYDTEKTLESLKKELKRRRRIFLWKKSLAYAAGIILLLSIGGYFLYQDTWQNRDEPVTLSKVLAPDFGKVYLEVKAGDRIEMTGEMDTIFEAKRVVCKKTDKDSVVRKISEPNWNRLFTTKGAEYFMVLSDGTKVWLNAESELKFPDVFQGKNREVYLKEKAILRLQKMQIANLLFILLWGASLSLELSLT